MASTASPEFKVILCGEWGVGKSSLFRRFTNNSFIDTSMMSAYQSRQSTMGLDHFGRKYESSSGRQLKMQLWDTGGLERVASITSSYYKFAEAALLVFSLNSLESFHCLSQHLLEILSMAENAKIFLVGNKLDLQPHEVTDSDIELFLEQFPKFNGIFKVSCKTNNGIEEMFKEIVDKLAGNYNFKTAFDTFQLHAQHEDCCPEDAVPPKEDFCCAK